jgi:hypothetical protein
MRRQSSCAAVSRERNGGVLLIGKVLHGADAGRLLYYLYGPGKANEHTDPHLVAGFAAPGQLEPERRRNGSPDFRRLSELLAQPVAALAGPGYEKPVWHCAVRAAPEDQVLSDAKWAQVAAGIMDRTGLAPDGDDVGVRWVAVRHAADHIHPGRDLGPPGRHPAENLERLLPGPGSLPGRRAAVRAAVHRPADRTAARRPARRDGAGSTARVG